MNIKEKISFEEIYKIYFNKVYNYIYRRVGNYDDTHDILSETFTALWKLWENIDPNRNIKSLIFTIATNKLNDHLKLKYKYNSNISFEEYEEFIEEREETDSENTYKPILVELISQLNDKDKKFVELRFIKNYKIKEIADEFSITVNNVKVTQNRIIKKLKNHWENYKL